LNRQRELEATEQLRLRRLEQQQRQAEEKAQQLALKQKIHSLLTCVDDAVLLLACPLAVLVCVILIALRVGSAAPQTSVSITAIISPLYLAIVLITAVLVVTLYVGHDCHILSFCF
jgi:fatty acid desaturase